MRASIGSFVRPAVIAPRKVELALDRERITREADPIGFLSAVMKGMPVAELDWEGEMIGHARPAMDPRIVAAREPLKKIVPDLKAVDVTAAEGVGIPFTFESPIPLPNSQPTNQLTLPAAVAADRLAGVLRHQIEDAIVEDGDA